MLSIIIITKNEEVNIRRCLDSVKWADEIIVLDSGSSDSTIAIAQEFTEYVYSSDDWLGYGVQKQRALNLASGDWVLNIDADEAVTDELKMAILNVMQENVADAYMIKICMNFYGTPLKHSCSPSQHIRLFKREGASYSDDIVHEKIILPQGAVVKKIITPLMHYCYQDISHALNKINHYSSYSAKLRLQKKKAPGLIRIAIGTAWMFFRTFILQGGFLDGQKGLLMAVFSAQGTFYRGMKQIYRDLPRRKPSVDINK